MWPMLQQHIVVHYNMVNFFKITIYIPGQNINGLVQDYGNSSALAMEFPQSCIKPSIFFIYFLSLKPDSFFTSDIFMLLQYHVIVECVIMGTICSAINKVIVTSGWWWWWGVGGWGEGGGGGGVEVGVGVRVRVQTEVQFHDRWYWWISARLHYLLC